MKKFGKIINIKSFKHAVSKANLKGDTIEKPLSSPSSENKSIVFPWIVAITATVAITFILAPTFKPHYTNLNTGDIAPKHIKASDDILVEDKTSTLKNKKRAEETSPDVYDFDTKLNRDITRRASTAFDLMTKFYKERVPDLYKFIEQEEERTEIDTDTTRMKKEMNLRLNKFETSDEFKSKEMEFQAILKVDLSDKSFKTLRWYHYKKEIRDNIADFVSQAMGIGVVGSMEFVNMDKGIVLREIGADSERVIPDASSIIDIRQANGLVKKLAEEGIPEEHKSLQAAISHICQKL
ncbi:MAG: hypothetical protein HY097_08600, partial [Nitrospinae bacterium]|nr:hypothetical protein [Nitrospinota bacterium]